MADVTFAKYHGLGNDFVISADAPAFTLTAAQVADVCDRRTGIGADGFIAVRTGTDVDLVVEHRNADGSWAGICGNGVRCAARFARVRGLANADELIVRTGAGLRRVVLAGDGSVTVDMGRPRLGELRERAEVDGRELALACLSMGNPHAVLFVEDVAAAPVEEVGAALQRHALFPDGVNVEFVAVERPDRLRMRVFERGVGETPACGSGACAAAVAARLQRGAADTVTVCLPGGDLETSWRGSAERPEPVTMRGPAAYVFDGVIVV